LDISVAVNFRGIDVKVLSEEGKLHFQIQAIQVSFSKSGAESPIIKLLLKDLSLAFTVNQRYSSNLNVAYHWQ
jgi:hypothetical protein